ncbi:DUF2971 domain-containing protein [Bradyrhizobium sp. DASA03068]|uniref:DUF2971 domain-containing protein n=1 Tax=Bradyrhizobium sp. BLXBL-01 TaxID=3395915 RepID=UPI003F7136EC
MAQVRLPDLPPRLYRYCRLDRPDDLDHEVSAFLERYVYASTYKGMNDPMEGFYEPSGRLKREPQWRQTYKDILNAKRATGIACFSETYDNELMWAHYANNYRGICIAYSSAKLRDNLPESARLVRVAYADAPIYLSKHDKADVVKAAQKILSQKKYNWAYEREWRVLGDYPGQLAYDGDVVTDVYFGSRISPDNKARILKAMGGRTINFHQMAVAGYRHSWKKVKRPELT